MQENKLNGVYNNINTNKMNCGEVKIKFEQLYFDGLSEKEKEEIYHHFKECDNCNLEYKAMSDLFDIIEDDKANIKKQSIYDDILYKLSNTQKPVGRGYPFKSIAIAASIAVFLIAGVISGYIAGNYFGNQYQITNTPEELYNEILAEDLHMETFDILLNKNQSDENGN